MTRRDFIGQAAAAGAGLVAGCASAGAAAPALAGNFVWGALLHLGSNMWGDWSPNGKFPKSAEEAARMLDALPASRKTPAFRKNGSALNFIRGDYLLADIPTWEAVTGDMRREGLNLLVIDIGEAYAYPSHPELWVNGSWRPERMRAELKRLRAMGLEPIPKLNFSTCHDIWLKQYHYMTSTRKYYQVVADLIRDVCEVFDRPRYFHLGFDEETPAGTAGRKLAVVRKGELWWHDLKFCAREAARHGARAIVWSDKICDGRDEFLKRMPKDILLMPWYYGTDFSARHTTWEPKWEKGKTLGEVQRNLAASIGLLADAGFDLIPCASNWSKDGSADALVAYCRKRVDPARLKGYLTAPWFMTLANQRQKLGDGIRLLGEAKRRHYS